MKIESVVRINIKGEYEVLYMGDSRGEARKVYKEHMLKKDEYMALFQQSGYSSRSMSKVGHQTHAFNKEVASAPAPIKKPRKKKISEE
tara:strand:- start:1455 stop:1718 length:264 start_codon:yes stop_codon:yes gene_type:complete